MSAKYLVRVETKCPGCGQPILSRLYSSEYARTIFACGSQERYDGSFLRSDACASTKITMLEVENAQLRALADAYLCLEHRDYAGLYSADWGENLTPAGGACVICKIERISIHLEKQMETLEAQHARLQALVDVHCRPEHHGLYSVRSAGEQDQNR